MHGSIALFVFTAAMAAAQQFPGAAGRQQDLDFVANTLPGRHPNFFFQLDRAAFQQAVSDLGSRVNTASDAEFYVGLERLIAMAGDAHTTLYFTGSPFLRLPLKFVWLDDGIFVAGASGAYSGLQGTQLVAVGGTPIDSAANTVGAAVSHENRYWLHHETATLLANETVLEGLGLAPPGGPAHLTLRSLDGHEFTAGVAPSNDTPQPSPSSATGPIPLYQRDTAVYYWFTYLPADKLLYFRYNSCSSSSGYAFGIFAQDLFKALDANPVETFVFDFRGNGGGDSNIIAPVFNGLADRFSALSANPRFRIYDVFDNGTFSSALNNAEDLLIPYPQSIRNPNTGVNLSTRVVSIGQPTGSKPSLYGNVVPFTLPASRIAGQVSTRFYNAPAGIPDLDSLMPSINVPLRSTDYFARLDPAMSMILGRASGYPAPPSGEVTVVSAAGFRTSLGVAPGSFAAAFGAFPAVADEIVVGGIVAKALAASSTQVNFRVPDATPVGAADVRVRAAGKEMAAGAVTITRSGPGIFSIAPADPAQPGAILNQDGSLNSAANPAPAGSIMQIFGTGYGGEDVRVYVAEQSAEVLYSGIAAGFPGLWQVNARIPPGIVGEASVFFFSGDLPSSGVTIRVR